MRIVAADLLPNPFRHPCLLLIEALTGRRQFVPIDRQLTSVPETEMYETSLGSRYVTYARIKRDANKLLADRSTSSFRIGKLNSPPPERSVISHRSRHHFGLISKLRFVIYNGHVYSRAPYLAGFIIFSTMPITPIVDQPIYLRFDPANTRIQPDKSAAPTKFSRFHRIHGFILDA